MSFKVLLASTILVGDEAADAIAAGAELVRELYARLGDELELITYDGHCTVETGVAQEAGLSIDIRRRPWRELLDELLDPETELDLEMFVVFDASLTETRLSSLTSGLRKHASLHSSPPVFEVVAGKVSIVAHNVI